MICIWVSNPTIIIVILRSKFRSHQLLVIWFPRIKVFSPLKPPFSPRLSKDKVRMSSKSYKGVLLIVQGGLAFLCIVF